jgi:hypothetical protein
MLAASYRVGQLVRQVAEHDDARTFRFGRHHVPAIHRYTPPPTRRTNFRNASRRPKNFALCARREIVLKLLLDVLYL